MSTSVRTVNQNAYQFVQSIASKFDQTKYPKTHAPLLILDSKKDGFKQTVKDGSSTKDVVFSGRKIRYDMATKLPPEMSGLIGSFTDNFSQWAVMNGLTDPKIKMPLKALDFSATSFLERMGIKRTSQSPSDQLKTHVFEQAFASFSEEEKLKLITEMQSCKTVTESYSFRMKLVIFNVQSAVATLLSYTLVKLVISVFIAWQSRKAYTSARVFFDKQIKPYYFPKTINYFMSYAPLAAVRVASLFVRTVKFIMNNAIKIQIVSFTVEWFYGSNIWVKRVSNIILLPITIPKFLFRSPFSILFKAFNTSNDIQSKLADASKTRSQNTQNQLIAENANKAYQLWMYLLKNPEQLYVK